MHLGPWCVIARPLTSGVLRDGHFRVGSTMRVKLEFPSGLLEEPLTPIVWFHIVLSIDLPFIGFRCHWCTDYHFIFHLSIISGKPFLLSLKLLTRFSALPTWPKWLEVIVQWLASIRAGIIVDVIDFNLRNILISWNGDTRQFRFLLFKALIIKIKLLFCFDRGYFPLILWPYCHITSPESLRSSTLTRHYSSLVMRCFRADSVIWSSLLSPFNH